MSLQIRNSYRVIKKKYDKIGKGNVRLTQSSLILMILIDATKDTYKFPVLESDNQTATFPEEIRLNINDEFVSYEVGFYIVAQTSLEGVADIEEGIQYWTYAPMELSAVFVGLQRTWNSLLQILVNKISRLEKWDLKKHNFVPRTQFQNTSAGIPTATQPSLAYREDGMFPMQPMVTLSGAKKNDIVITLSGGSVAPSGVVTWTPPVGGVINYNVTKLAMIFRGMLAQNGAKFQ